MTRLEVKVDRPPLRPPWPPMRSAGCGNRASMAVPHPQQEGVWVDGWIYPLGSTVHPSTFPEEEYRSAMGSKADPWRGPKRGRLDLWPEGRSHAVRGQVSRNHEGLGPLGSAGQRRMDRTFWNGSAILSPVMKGRLSRPCLHLLGGPALPLHFSPTTRPQTAPFPGVVPLSPHLTTFSDTAHALSRMDLVVTVDTALAHLAGALGIPCWLLVTHVPDPCWLLDRSDSPWYPTVRIFRQPRPGDWESVIQEVVLTFATEFQRCSGGAA